MGVFFLRACVLVCGFCFRALCDVFGGSPSVFSVRCCVLSVGFVFVMVCNGSNFACMAFCLFFGVLDRV